ncbi:MAG: hypothetical protein ACD_76C00090G0001 [uncultured bacterium]|nr:MAG: hypothetical protein ACD_76C00090G0001 [uncultured bacterium]
MRGYGSPTEDKEEVPMKWKRVCQTEGTLVAGERSAPPTHWWNYLYLAFFGWKTIVTLCVPDSVAQNGYFVGFTTMDGASWVKTEAIQHDKFFSMRIGHEDTRFFVMTITNPELLGIGTQAAKLVLPEVVARGPLH